MNEPEVVVKKKITLIRGTGAYNPPVGKKRAKPGTVTKILTQEEEQKKA